MMRAARIGHAPQCIRLNRKVIRPQGSVRCGSPGMASKDHEGYDRPRLEAAEISIQTLLSLLSFTWVELRIRMRPSTRSYG